MKPALALFWYLFTHQTDTVLNVFFYPYLLESNLTYCMEGDCHTYPTLPFFAAVLFVDVAIFLALIRLLVRGRRHTSRVLDQS